MPADHVSPQEIDLLRALKQAAIVLLLFLRARQPLGSAEVARMLEISPRTAREHLHDLVALGYLEPLGKRLGYRLTESAVDFISGRLNTVVVAAVNINTDSTATTTDSNPSGENSPLPEINGEKYTRSLAALEAYGVDRNSKTLRLAQQHSAEVIHATAAGLKQQHGVVRPGLLVYMLGVRPADPPRNSEEGRRRYAEWESSGK